MANEVLDRVKKVVGEVLEVDPGSIADTARFVEDLGAQSIQSVELVAAFEEEFDVEMDDEASLAVKTVDGAARFITKVIEAQNG